MFGRKTGISWVINAEEGQLLGGTALLVHDDFATLPFLAQSGWIQIKLFACRVCLPVCLCSRLEWLLPGEQSRSRGRVYNRLWSRWLSDHHNLWDVHRWPPSSHPDACVPANTGGLFSCTCHKLGTGHSGPAHCLRPAPQQPWRCVRCSLWPLFLPSSGHVCLLFPHPQAGHQCSTLHQSDAQRWGGGFSVRQWWCARPWDGQQPCGSASAYWWPHLAAPPPRRYLWQQLEVQHLLRLPALPRLSFLLIFLYRHAHWDAGLDLMACLLIHSCHSFHLSLSLLHTVTLRCRHDHVC